MILFVKLLIAHILGDFTFQAIVSKFKNLIGKRKGIRSFLYALFHGVLLIAVLMSKEYAVGILFLMVIHFVAELWKLNKRADESENIGLLISQVIFVGTIAVVSDWYTPWITTLISGVSTNQMFLFALSILLTTIVSSRVIKGTSINCLLERKWIKGN